MQFGAIVVIVAVGVGGAFLYYQQRVCDQQLDKSGDPVETCRHLQLTDPPIIFLGLIVLVSLMAFFSEISGFGFTLKRAFKETQEQLEQTQLRQEADSARIDVAEDQVDAAVQKSSLAQGLAQGAAERIASDAPTPATQPSGIDDLIKAFDGVRINDPVSSRARSAKLTEVVGRMVSRLTGVPRTEFDVAGHIEGPDGGGRIAGYAYVYANPSVADATMLIQAILRPDQQRFGQYWAIRALARIIAANPGTTIIDETSRKALTRLLEQLPPNSDRARELRPLLS